MSVGFDLLKALFILLPGFLTLKIIEDLAYTRPFRSDLERVIQGFVYTFIDYSILYILLIATHRIEPIRHFLDELQLYVSTSLKMGPPPPIPSSGLLSELFLGLYVISILNGLIIGWSCVNGWLLNLLNTLNIAKKTGRPSIWLDAFIEMPKDIWVAVNFEDQRRLIGLIHLFSDTLDEGMLYLTQAQWVELHEPDNQIIYRPIPGPGILITNKWPIQSIEFLYPNSE